MSQQQAPLIPMEYRDANGVQHRALVPADGSAAPEEGIPDSLDISPVYAHLKESFLREMTEALWSRGLITAADYVKPGAAELARSALLSVVKADALDLVSLARQELKNHA